MTIVEFIDQFENKAKDPEVLRDIFTNGYCYYFAKMLEIAFPGGEVCLCYPKGHFVHSYEDKAYDIWGENHLEETLKLIPAKEMGPLLGDFLWNGTEHNTSKEEIAALGGISIEELEKWL